jgi:hypothetical protein
MVEWIINVNVILSPVFCVLNYILYLFYDRQYKKAGIF